MAEYEKRLADLSEELDSFKRDYEDDAPETKNEEDIFLQEGFLDKLAAVIEVIREAHTANYTGFPDLTKQADRVFSNAARWAYENESPVGAYSESHMPSFAHNETVVPLLKDPSKDVEFSHGFTGSILPELQTLLEIFGSTRNAADVKANMKLPPAWKTTLRPHPFSAPCARFRDSIPEWTASETNNRATAVFEARCEVSSGDIPTPWGLRLSANGDVLALSSMGGWKNRTPYIYYYLPNHEEDTTGGFMKEHAIKADLVSTIKDVMVDDQRRLVFAADWQRVKSYQCNDPTVRGSKANRVHTLDSADYTGPLAMLPNGRILRAGKENIAVWELDTLETHGESGKDVIGNKMEADKIETWRDDPKSIEPSTGSTPSTTVTLDTEGDGGEEGFVINKWHQHPSQANVMLSATDSRTSRFYCHAFDVEAGGKAVTRYLGHGGTVDGFSTSAADPNVFLTWCSDGHARLYDVRQVLPVLTIASASDLEPLPAAVLAHADGIPFVFMGTESSQHIKLWDIRARQSVYELATGNNGVDAMAWDASNNTLYASTSCPNVDRNGRHTGYRRARIPKARTEQPVENPGDDDDEWEDSDDEDAEDE